MQKETCLRVAGEHPGQGGPNIQEHLEVHDPCPFCIRDGLQTAGEKP